MDVFVLENITVCLVCFVHEQNEQNRSGYRNKRSFTGNNYSLTMLS